MVHEVNMLLPQILILAITLQRRLGKISDRWIKMNKEITNKMTGKRFQVYKWTYKKRDEKLLKVKKKKHRYKNSANKDNTKRELIVQINTIQGYFSVKCSFTIRRGSL